MNHRSLACLFLLALACGPVKAPEHDGDAAVANGDGAPPDAFSGDACPTDPCVVNPFASTGEDGAFAPDSDTVLAPGIYHFTTITIPAGVTVTTSSNARLDMRASGPVVIEGVIDVSGARGGDGGVGTGTCFGGGGDGGATGNPVPTVGSGTGLCGVRGPGGAGSDGYDGGEYGSEITCPLQGGVSGGGTGGATCLGGGGGGGFAGGGGGGGYTTSFGGEGASYSGSSGGAGGLSNDPGIPRDATGGGGGVAPGQYRGIAGDAVASCAPSYPGGSGGGGSIGARSASDLAVATTFYVGSGGGGGAGQCNACNYDGGGGAGGGGGGGGAIRVASGTSMSITGAIRATGGDGGNAGPSGSGGGGGGSGGVVYLSAPAMTVATGAEISAVGGGGGSASDGVGDCGTGGRGGIGRIRLSVGAGSCTLDGTFDPPLADGCTASAASAKVYIAEYPD
jgi:hypothetical protein